MCDCEKWKAVPGWERYEVSNLGNVRRKIAVRKTPAGYPMVQFTVNRQWKVEMIHTLVAALFIGPRPQGLVINHKDGNKANPDFRNLEYVTSSENALHARRSGLFKDRPRVLCAAEVIAIRGLLAAKTFSKRTIATIYSVSQSTITDIKLGRSWANSSVPSINEVRRSA